jgi:hypothetical protein
LFVQIQNQEDRQECPSYFALHYAGGGLNAETKKISA